MRKSLKKTKIKFLNTKLPSLWFIFSFIPNSSYIKIVVTAKGCKITFDTLKKSSHMNKQSKYLFSFKKRGYAMHLEAGKKIIYLSYAACKRKVINFIRQKSILSPITFACTHWCTHISIETIKFWDFDSFLWNIDIIPS